MKRRRWAFVVLVLASIVWSLLQFAWHRSLIGDIQDDGEYFVAAQALRDGRGYVLPSRPLTPPATKYPAGTSAVAALFLEFVPGRPTLESDYCAVRVSLWAVGVAFLWASFAWLTAAGVDDLVAASAAAFGLINVNVLPLGSALLSDLPFALMTALAFWCWYARAERDGGKWSLLAGALGGMATSIRSQGISLPLGLAFGLLLESRRGRFMRSVAMAFGAAAVVVPVYLLLANRALALPPEHYINDFRYYTERPLSNLGTSVTDRVATYLLVPGNVILPMVNTRYVQQFPFAGNVVVILLSVVTALGAGQILKRSDRNHWPVVIHWAASMGILVIWPWNLGCRPFVWTMPLYFVLFSRGLVLLTSFNRPKGLRLVRVSVLIVVATASVVATGYITYVRGRAVIDSDTAGALTYLRKETPSDAIVITFTPESCFLYTGRQAIKLPLDADRICGRVGKADHLLQWSQHCPGRPMYLLGCSRESDAELGAHYECVEADPRFQARRVFASASGRVWIDVIRTPNPLRPEF